MEAGRARLRLLFTRGVGRSVIKSERDKDNDVLEDTDV